MDWLPSLQTVIADGVAHIVVAAIFGAATVMLGVLLFGRNYKKRIAELEKRPAITIHGGIHIGDVYIGPDGQHHMPIDGKGEIVSSEPLDGIARAEPLTAVARISRPQDEGR